MRRSGKVCCEWLLLICGALLAGCRNNESAPSKPAASFPGVSIKVGALGDGAILTGVSPQRGEWEASRKGSIAIHDESLTLETLSNIDVVLFPAQQLGDLVNAGVLAPIPNAAVLPPSRPRTKRVQPRPNGSGTSPEAAQDEHLSVQRHRTGIPVRMVSKYGPERVALPCGGSALVLVYRRDAFESVPNREAARQAGLSLEQPPATWPQLDAVAKFFQGRDWNGDRAPGHGIAAQQPWGRRRGESAIPDSAGASGQPGSSSRPVLVLVRCRRHDSANCQPSVR